MLQFLPPHFNTLLEALKLKFHVSIIAFVILRLWHNYDFDSHVCSLHNAYVEVLVNVTLNITFWFEIVENVFFSLINTILAMLAMSPMTSEL